jgi:hypothetical protein
MRPVATCAIVLGLSSVAAADVVEVTTNDDVEAAIAALQPGDELIVHGGTYTLAGRFSVTAVGTAAMPIVIRAADGEQPIFHRPDASENIWDIDNAEYLTIRGLEFSGGSAGVRISGARFLTIEGCEIHDTNDVALRANDGGARYEGLRILRNHIHDTDNTGEGMYLGCNTNACQVFDSLIEGNYVHHTNAPTVDQGDGIELKEGSYNNIIRDNVIHDTNYPCILTYSTVGNGAPNIIERNAMWGCGDHAIQSAADAVIRNNIILGSVANGIAMQVHQSGSPSNLVVVHNTVLHPTNTAISVSGATGSVVIANNAVYAQSGSAISGGGGTVTAVGNVGVGGGGVAAGDLATDFVAANYNNMPPVDVFPASGGGLVATGDVAHVVLDDFNGTPRDGIADVGAYRFSSTGNPGWVLAPDFKDLTPPPPGSVDASPSANDGAGGPDSGGGCGCRSSSPPSSLVLVLLVALVLSRSRGTLQAWSRSRKFPR